MVCLDFWAQTEKNALMANSFRQIYPCLFGNGIESTYPSSSSRSTGKTLEEFVKLTKVLGVGVHIRFGLIVEEEIVHLQVQDHHVGSSQVLLSSLDHGDLLAQHAGLTETHVSLHS